MSHPSAGLPSPEALILDLDGTLVDTVEARIRAWLAVFAEYDIPVTRPQVAPLIGSDGRWLARRVASDAGLDLPPGRDEEIDRRSGEIYETLNRDPRPLPGARQLLLDLERRGLPWAIATSSRREQVGASVHALRLPRPPTIVDGTHVEHAKPAPDLLLLAARELDVPPTAAWYIGDSTWDMASAQAAGMTAVGVLAGSAVGAGDLRAAGAVSVVRTLDELQSRLGQQPP
ncbi:MAG TPA: HAD family phosphatase [candidate division Zixibacteria bacterium]|nr:HAD family phosphatase [candidate division Zixibacteria bacterium]